jgi:chromosome segregation ATPase
MSNEDMQRKMEFIVEQQAHITASLQQFDEHWKRIEEERVRDRPRMKELEQSFKRLVELAEISESRLDDLESRSTKLETRNTALETNMAALAEAQTHADERVSALIDIIMEGRNGPS